MNKQGAVDISTYGLAVGTPSIKSVGPLTFGPEGILFVADNVAATITAIDVRDADAASEPHPIDVDKLDTRLAAYLGCSRDDVFIKDIAVHPTSQNVYLSVMRGSGEAAVPVLIKVGIDGALSEVGLQSVPFAQTAIENAPAEDDRRKEWRALYDKREGADMPMRDGSSIRSSRDQLRTVTVTDMAYVDGVLLVAGASNEEFSSALRRIPFPFNGDMQTNSLEIYHVSHGRYETASPIRKFVPYDGNRSLLASYTCTPIAQFSLNDFKAGMLLKGKTVAELGGGNTPIDMVSYKRDGQEYLLVANVTYPMVKIACNDIDRQEPLTEHREPVGVPRQTMPQQGVFHMANLNGSYVLMLHMDEAGNVDLRSHGVATL